MNQTDRRFATKTEWVYDELRQRILRGRFKPDDRLRLTQLAREFQTSEMPVREALRMLQRDGLVIMESHRGASVANLSWSRAAEIVSMRMHLEALAAAEAAPAHDAKSLAELGRLLERMDLHAAAGEAIRFSALNREFHRRLYAPGGNGALKAEIEELWDRVWRARAQPIFGAAPERMKAAQAEHRALLSAVATGDAATARTAADRHREATLATWRILVDQERSRADET